MKAFKCYFPIWFWCSECTTQPETMFFSVDFLCDNMSIVPLSWYIDFVCLYAKKKKKNYIVFTCVNSLLFLLPFIIFIVLLSFIINFRFNFFLDFHTISLFHLNWKISFGFLPMKEKSLGLLELASKMQEIWPCIEQPMICPKQNKRFKCNRFQHDYRNIWIKNFNEAYIMQM